MRIAYVRVSSVDQNEARQIEGLKKHNIEKWFVEKASAKDTSRPQLQTMLEFAREGDTIYIHDFSRLARSTADLLKLVEQLNQKGIHLVSDKESIDTSTATGKLMLTMIGAINEFERANLLERQKEGIAIAKRNGCYKGGKKGRNTAQFDEALYKELLVAYQHRKISKSAMAKRLGVSRPTLNKMMKSNLL
jgi:DNA invertase Pin-like site-specific DNA recombinase